MQNNRSASYLFDCPGRYQIRAWGVMDERWASRLHEMQISIMHAKNQLPVTKITGWFVDQTELS